MNTLKIKDMGETNQHGVMSFLLSAILTFLTAITVDDVKSGVTIVGGISAAVCGIWGIYSHHLTIKIKKKELEKLK